MESGWKRKLIAVAGIGGAYLAARKITKKMSEEESIDDGNPYLNTAPLVGRQARVGIYESKVKPALDHIFSFGGLVMLSPLFGLISLAVYLDDPGPVIFTQKRVGKDRHYVMIHKFRTMAVSAPHDVPTHELYDSGQYITKAGKVLRRTSLDELPQIWDIFRGRMSVVGPRPALWNQDDLVAERDKYGANDVLPGLTGLAQVKGRDKLEIADKARLDGDYVEHLKKGGIKAMLFDVAIFLKTVTCVLRHDGVREGGTGRKGITNHNGMTHTNNYIETVSQKPKKILITGEASYIGENVKAYLESVHDGFYQVDVVNTVGLTVSADMFYGYNVVINVAGIAHIQETNENRHLYYEVNRDLAVAIAKNAKEAGVGQFIEMSSMSVYGMATGHICKDMAPYPASAYGESKLSADETIERLADENFHVAVLRPPMVYGKGCKGNYQTLRKFALKSPIFPSCKNKRSMIFIGNLCEFIKRVIDTEGSGLFFPQDSEYVNTADMVSEVAKLHGRKINTIPFFNLAIRFIPFNLVKKVFGSLTYEKIDLVEKYSFEDSMYLTEHGYGFRRMFFEK